MTSWEGRRPSRGARARAAALVRRADPVRVVDLVQTGKTALAAGLAWWVATGPFQLEQPFLAPWAAVLVVHATVYKTVSRGGQQVAATFFAVVLAFGLGSLLGTSPWSIGAVVLIGYLLGQLSWIKDEAGTVATTGLVTLATGSIAQTNLLSSRLVDTAVGVGVGLVVNLLVWPPLRDRAAWSHAEGLPADLAAILEEMADGLAPDLDPAETTTWVRGLRRVDLAIDEAWRLLWQAQESGRLNPRRSQPAGIGELKSLLHALEQAVADSLSMARTIARSAEEQTPWDAAFRERWRAAARTTARGVRDHDVALLEAQDGELRAMATDFSATTLPPDLWREYAGLLMNLGNVHDALARALQWVTETSPGRQRAKRRVVPADLVRRQR